MPSDIPALAEIAVEPGAVGDEHARAVQEAMNTLEGADLDIVPGAASTVIHGPLTSVCQAIMRAHMAAQPHAERVVTTVRLETRDGADFTERLGIEGQ